MYGGKDNPTSDLGSIFHIDVPRCSASLTEDIAGVYVNCIHEHSLPV